MKNMQRKKVKEVKMEFDVEKYEKRNAMPWDLIFPGKHYVPEEVFEERYNICSGCEFFTKKAPRLCKKCHCWMKVKATLGIAYCPVGKWGPYEGELVERKWFKNQEEQDLSNKAMETMQEAAIESRKEQENNE